MSGLVRRRCPTGRRRRFPGETRPRHGAQAHRRDGFPGRFTAPVRAAVNTIQRIQDLPQGVRFVRQQGCDKSDLLWRTSPFGLRLRPGKIRAHPRQVLLEQMAAQREQRPSLALPGPAVRGDKKGSSHPEMVAQFPSSRRPDLARNCSFLGETGWSKPAPCPPRRREPISARPGWRHDLRPARWSGPAQRHSYFGALNLTPSPVRPASPASARRDGPARSCP